MILNDYCYASQKKTIWALLTHVAQTEQTRKEIKFKIWFPRRGGDGSKFRKQGDAISKVVIGRECHLEFPESS